MELIHLLLTVGVAATFVLALLAAIFGGIAFHRTQPLSNVFGATAPKLPPREKYLHELR